MDFHSPVATPDRTLDSQASPASSAFSAATPDRLHEQVPVVMDALNQLQRLNQECEEKDGLIASLRAQLDTHQARADAPPAAPATKPPTPQLQHGMPLADDVHSCMTLADDGFLSSDDEERGSCEEGGDGPGSEASLLRLLQDTLHEQQVYLDRRASSVHQYRSALQQIGHEDSGLASQLRTLTAMRETHIKKWVCLQRWRNVSALPLHLYPKCATVRLREARTLRRIQESLYSLPS